MQKGKQRYKCVSCGCQFTGGNRVTSDQLWQEYVYGKQTYIQLSIRYSLSIKTIQRKLDGYKLPVTFNNFHPKEGVVLMDSTYFGRQFGVMVFMDARTGVILYKRYIKHETVALYKEGLSQIQQQGYKVLALVCDGKRGIFQAMEMPVQMCHFHQVAIITRYITRRPKMPAAIELKSIVSQLPKSDKQGFLISIKSWNSKWESFLSERTTNPLTGRTTFTHKRLRSAYRSIMANMSYLFVYKDFKELNIPNTNNCLEGIFTSLKNSLRNHNGLSINRRRKFIDEFFKA